MKYAVITSSHDLAGKNIRKSLLKIKETSHDVSFNNTELFETNKEIVHCEDIDEQIEADCFIFASKHKGGSGIPSLSVHPIGNWGKAELGGKEKELCKSMPGLMKRAFTLMKEKAPLEYDVIYEATHHGPYIEKPAMFIEIGSTELEWSNSQAGLIIAEVILESIKLGPIKSVPTFCIGGQHTCTNFVKILEKSDVSISHCCPKYSLESFDEKMLEQALKRSVEKTSNVMVDWKGLGQHKERVKNILEENKINYAKTDKVKCGVHPLKFLNS